MLLPLESHFRRKYRGNLYEPGLHKDLLDRNKKGKARKEKNTDKMEHIKNKTKLCHSKGTNKKMKEKARDWEKIVIEYISYKVFVINIRKKTYNSKK